MSLLPNRPTNSGMRKNRTALALLIGLFTCGANAQVLVTDTTSIATNNAGFAAQLAKTVEQYAQQIQSYATQVQQYQQMLTKVMNLGTNFSLVPNSMQEIDADPLIQANCNSSSGSVASDLLNQVTSLVSQPISQSQKTICAQIVMTQVDKYNQTVRMMNQIQSNIPAVQKVADLAGGFSNLGESSSATTQINSYSSQLTTSMSSWKARIDADDAYISSLQGMQSTLAQSSLRGNPSLVGDAVQAAALTAAFTIDQ